MEGWAKTATTEVHTADGTVEVAISCNDEYDTTIALVLTEHGRWTWLTESDDTGDWFMRRYVPGEVRPIGVYVIPWDSGEGVHEAAARFGVSIPYTARWIEHHTDVPRPYLFLPADRPV